MELRQLRYFVALAEERSFGLAAERLHIVSSALSKQMMALESELGIELIDRSHGVVLTAAGERFFADAREIVARTEQAVGASKAIARGMLGDLVIGFTPSAMWSVLPVILREHRSRYPQLNFRLNELGSPEVMNAVRDGTTDVGFLRAAVPDDLVELEPLWRERVVLGLSENHPLASESAVKFADLRDEAFILINAHSRSDAPRGLPALLFALCDAAGFTPRRIEEANSAGGMTMVALGLGVALFPESAQDAGQKGITFRALSDPTPEIDLIMAYRHDNDTPALQEFLGTAREVVPDVRAHGRPVSTDRDRLAPVPGNQVLKQTAE